jgi:hypothetical protein
MTTATTTTATQRKRRKNTSVTGRNESQSSPPHVNVIHNEVSAASTSSPSSGKHKRR